MIVENHPLFDKHFRKRIRPHKNLIGRYQERLTLLIKEPNNPILKLHHLTGSKSDLYAFSVTGDIRIIFRYKSEDHVILLDIGTHNQVY